MALSMSPGLATPSSTMRIASMPRVMPRRLEANPGESLTTMGSFPMASTMATALVRVASSTRSWTTISTSFMMWTGLKKWSPKHRSGWGRPSAMAANDSDEVLLARMAPSFTTGAAAAMTERLTSRSSTTASMTKSTPVHASATVSAVVRRSRVASSSSCVIFWRSTAPASCAAMVSRAAGSASGRASDSTVHHPAMADTWAMPAPMVPAPMTATRRTPSTMVTVHDGP